MSTLKEIYDNAIDNYYYLWNGAKSLERDVKIYLHWTAGTYGVTFPDYHICITGDGTIHQTASYLDQIESTYRRNTGSVSVALCCAYGAMARTPSDYWLGDCPPTEAQIDTAEQVIAVLAKALDLTIDLARVMTHAEAADNLDGLAPCDPYGPSNGCERWDLSVLHQGDQWMSGGNILREKAKEYQGIITL